MNEWLMSRKESLTQQITELIDKERDARDILGDTLTRLSMARGAMMELEFISQKLENYTVTPKEAIAEIIS